MDETVFQEIAKLALKGSGQLITPARAYLVETRLNPLLRREDFGSIEELLACFQARPNSSLREEAVAALTSKTSRFFDGREMLKRIVDHVLPMMVDTSGGQPLRMWCAGGAAGHEAYSLAMLLEETRIDSVRHAQIEILTTDICEKQSESARRGRFGHFDVQKGLSIHRLLEHFTRLDTGEWQISPALASRVGVRTHNLLTDASGLGLFDVILCRNVLKDMAPQARTQALLTVARQLTDGGILILGEGETATGLIDGLEPSRDVRGAFTRQVARDALTIAA
ncbi:protein-glutamate O-methyltransferase CheR [Henriciella sp.]|uniref:CheR family methyltransferase n=1 Tax=Henriciella sp. TaxID=1968823 RepID=UPI00260F7A96|nr:protein-glutamate O-methyltransferase CheR [Henriciella sp.]